MQSQPGSRTPTATPGAAAKDSQAPPASTRRGTPTSDDRYGRSCFSRGAMSSLCGVSLHRRQVPGQGQSAHVGSSVLAFVCVRAHIAFLPMLLDLQSLWESTKQDAGTLSDEQVEVCCQVAKGGNGKHAHLVSSLHLDLRASSAHSCSVAHCRI